MSAVEDGEQAPAEVHAIGISFGNSNSSIAYTSGVRITRSKIPRVPHLMTIPSSIADRVSDARKAKLK